MRLIIVRHGQTKWNVDKIMQGQQNNPLDETGIQQAKRVAGWDNYAVWKVLPGC